MNRRGFLFGATALVAAPAIVRASSLMPLSVLDPLMINPPDFWMSPEPDDVIPDRWHAGWWGEGSYDMGGWHPVGSRYELVDAKRVPGYVRESTKDIYVIRHPGECAVVRDRVRPMRFMDGAGTSRWITEVAY